jgi:hypothetical protein
LGKLGTPGVDQPQLVAGEEGAGLLNSNEIVLPSPVLPPRLPGIRLQLRPTKVGSRGLHAGIHESIAVRIGTVSVYPTRLEVIMKATYLLASTLLLATTVSGAWADDEPLTRAQVKAELHAAQLAGEIPSGDLDITRAQLLAGRSPTQTAASTLTREQVKDELRQAQAAGDVEVGDTGRTQAEIDPARYPSHPTQVGKTRAQVRAETAAAISLGEREEGDSGRTDAEINPQRYAAARAATEAVSEHLAAN